MAVTNMHATVEEVLEAVFSVRSCRGYITRSLETAVRRVGGWCEMADSLGVSQLEQLVSCE
jgi:hypothetical protein